MLTNLERTITRNQQIKVLINDLVPLKMWSPDLHQEFVVPKPYLTDLVLIKNISTLNQKCSLREICTNDCINVYLIK